jgi:hypothetical protein
LNFSIFSRARRLEDTTSCPHHLIVDNALVAGVDVSVLNRKAKAIFLHHVGELAQTTQTRIAAWRLMDNHVLR